MKTALILGGGGFIGGHLGKRLKSEGYWVRIVDIKRHEHFSEDEICNEFLVYDLRDTKNVPAPCIGPSAMAAQSISPKGPQGPPSFPFHSL